MTQNDRGVTSPGNAGSVNTEAVITPQKFGRRPYRQEGVVGNMKVVKDIYYAGKSVLATLSGFDCLQSREGDGEWVQAEPEDNMYYVCARFRNGRHLPLPLVVGYESEYPIQNRVLRMLRGKGMLKQAEEACQNLVGQNKSIYADPSE